jgi:signal transduction histidine kinase
LGIVGGEAEERRRERLEALGEIAAEVAHELRNVLQIVSASAYVAREEAARGNAAAALIHITKIERNARAAHAIVDDLMSLARSEPLARESVLLVDVVAAAREQLPTPAAEWIDEIEPRDLRVRAHPGLLVRLLHVLYDNALLASAPRSPAIVTHATAADGRMIVDVSDDGPGVPQEVMTSLFEPLASARAGGTGLGLALARRIVSAHGGSIALLRSQPGATTFRIDLPS